MGGGDDPEIAGKWVKKGVQWIQMGGDYSLMLRGASEVLARMEEYIRARTSGEEARIMRLDRDPLDGGMY